MEVEPPSFLTVSDLAVTRMSTAVKSWTGFCSTAWVFSGTLVSCSPLTDQLRHRNVAIYHLLLSFWFTFRVRQNLTSQLCKYCLSWPWIRGSYMFLLSQLILNVLSGNLPAWSPVALVVPGVWVLSSNDPFLMLTFLAYFPTTYMISDMDILLKWSLYLRSSGLL